MQQAGPAKTDQEALEATWYRVLITGLPLIVLSSLGSMFLSRHDFWDDTIDFWLNTSVFVLVSFVWLGTRLGRLSLGTIIRALVYYPGLMMSSKLALLLFFLPDSKLQMEEVAQLLVWFPAVITWAMLTELPISMKRALHVSMACFATLSALLVWKSWATYSTLTPGYVGTLFQINLASLVTLYGATSFTHRNEILGRLRGERETLARLAYSDLLTGLPGRLRLHEDMERLTTVHLSGPVSFVVLFIDMDNFKVINDTLGHETGDEILRLTAGELARHIPSGSTLYRISGDEFVALLLDTTTEQAEQIALEMQRQTQESVIQHKGLSTTLSIGLSLYPDDAQDAMSLLRHADSAMYSVKRSGRSQVHRYHPQQDSLTERYQMLLRDLALAIPRQELHLVFQPIFDLSTGQICKAEALLRWRHSELGSISPAEFIPVAERGGLIGELGQWVLIEACQRARQWPEIKISVNISAVQLLRTDFVQSIQTILETEGVSAEQLELELTETAVLYDDDRAIQTVRQLRALGLRLIVDDFGSGYSNLMRLRSLRISGLKVDQTITAELAAGKAREFAEAVIRAAVTLCAPLGIEVTVEGIETAEHLSAVKHLGCQLGQGYGLQVPMAWDDLIRQFRSTESSAAAAPV